MTQPSKKKDRSIRGLDQELYNQARADAVRQGKTIGTWLNEAIAEKLNITKAGKKVGS